MRTLKMMIGLMAVMLAGGCAQSVRGLDTTDQRQAASDCQYHPEPKGLLPIKLESPSTAVLNPATAPKRAIVVKSGVCSGRDAIDVVELEPDGEPTRDPAGKPLAQKFKVRIVPTSNW